MVHSQNITSKYLVYNGVINLIDIYTALLYYDIMSRWSGSIILAQEYC